MKVIRLMQEADLDAVRCIEATAFTLWWRGLSGGTTELPQRTQDNVLSCLEKDPEGCFVAEVEDQVVGFIFSRTWGKVGWFGTFGVLPEYQGSGLGKALMAESLAYLRQSVNLIGLETMPESPYNLGLYLKEGFQAGWMTFILSKNLEREAVADLNLPCWSSADQITRQRWLSELQQGSLSISPGYDYTKEIISLAKHEAGETLVLLKQDRAIGMCNVLLKNPRQGSPGETASLEQLLIHPDDTDVDGFHTLLQAAENLARAQSKRMLNLFVNARHSWALKQALEWGYRVQRARLRLTLEGSQEAITPDNWVNCSTWAG